MKPYRSTLNILLTYHRRTKLSVFVSFGLIGLYLLVPTVLYILPETYFDTGQSLCISKLIFHIECYACGMTRACMRLIHLNYEDAILYNKLSLIVFPLLVYLWAYLVFDEVAFLVKKLKADK